MPSTADELLHLIREDPSNIDRREAAARALMSEGRAAEAHDMLRERLENLVAHDPIGRARSAAPGGAALPAVPCLCKRCIDPALGVVTVDGLEMLRDFVVSNGRVLFFWVPSSLRDEAGKIRDAVRAELDTRLARGKWVSNRAGAYSSDDDDDLYIDDDDDDDELDDDLDELDDGDGDGGDGEKDDE